MNENRHARPVPTGIVVHALAAALAAGLVHGTVSAREADPDNVELWLSDAPLARVLGQIAGRDGIDVVVGSDVDDRVDGRLDGQRELVLATLAVEYGLSVHAEGDTVWFDRVNRPVVSLVRLSPPEATRALESLEPTLDDGSVVQLTDEGLVLSGSRAFVEGTRRHVADIVSSSATPSEPSIAAGAERTGDAPRREVRSVWDIPGYDVDYTEENAS